MHARPPEFVYADAQLQLMRWDDTFVMRWISDSGVPHVQKMIDEHHRFVDALPASSTMAFTHVDMANVRPVDEKVRRLIGEYDEAMHSRVRASATVIAARGFGGVVVRGVMSGLALVNRRKIPQAVFSTAREAIDFLHGHELRRPGETPAPLEDLIATYERAITPR